MTRVVSITRAAVALAALLLAAGAAWGHAFLERAEPRVGSTVKAPPSQVRAWFTQSLEPAFSTLEVVNERGDRVDRGPAKADAANPTLLQVPLKPLGPGTYRVKWRVLSVDTHVTEGDFTFRVTEGP
jgi:methionine-rich copper-binding protein CopC